MMKKIILIVLVLYSFLTCSKPGDCVESTGKLVSKTVAVAPFTKIYVKQGIELIVKQGLDYEVVIKTGENLVNDISVSQDGNTITLKDNTTCNLTYHDQNFPLFHFVYAVVHCVQQYQ